MEGDRDDLSSVSFVSTISAASSTHQPRPPDGPKPSSQRFHTKTGKVVRSPYLATSTPYPAKKKQKRSVHDSMGSQSQLTRDQWAKPAKRNSVAHPSASSFLQSLMMTGGFSTVLTGTTVNKRKRTHSAASALNTKKERTKANSVSSAAAPLTTDTGQLDPIALRDETVRLKQLINSVINERDVVKGQLGKVQAEVARKDKQIQDLLVAGHLPTRDATRTLVSSKQRGSQPSGTHAALSSLRVKVHSLEQLVREKEKELANLRSEVSVSKVKEMEIQTETYYREICRLTQLLSEREGSQSAHSERDAQIKLKALNQATVKMAAQLEEMEHNNSQLLRRLQKYEVDQSAVIETSTHAEHGLRGSIADKYVDHKRSQLLSVIVDLELRIQEQDSSIKSLVTEMENKKSHYERRIGELTGAQNDSHNQLQSLKAQMAELVSSRDKLQNVVRKLKDDRTHYRAVAENTQESLATVQEHLESEKMNKSGVLQELEALREKHHNEMTAIEHARKLASRKSRVFTPERERQQDAASTIQHHWRRQQAVTKQRRFEEGREQAVLDLQSALRGHLVRKQMVQGAKVHQEESIRHGSIDDLFLTEDSDDGLSDTSDAVETIQAAMRGYMARQMAMKDFTRPEPPSTPVKATTVRDMWRSGNQMEQSNVSHLIGYQPPPSQPKLVEHSKQASVRGPARTSGPWHIRLTEESSDGDQIAALNINHHLTHSLSSSDESELTPMDNTEHTLLFDEL